MIRKILFTAASLASTMVLVAISAAPVPYI